MKQIIQKTMFIVLAFMTVALTAEILVYPFTDEVKEQRFNHLITELRCPKCQNNNLADSNALQAGDLKDIIYEKIKAGETDEEIIDYLTIRYGDFINYRPPVKPSTWLIWYGPFAFLLLGGFFVFRYISSRQRKQNVSTQKDNSIGTDEMISQWSAEIEDDNNKDKL